MTNASDLRVAVVSTEARQLSNRLWYAARERVKDLRIFSPFPETGEQLPEFQTGLRSAYVLKQNHTFRYLQGLEQQLRKFDPDIVHINGEPWALDNLMEFCRRPGIVAHGAENQFILDGVVAGVRYGLTWAVAHHLAGYVSWNHAGADAIGHMVPGLPTFVTPAIIPPPHFIPSSWRGDSDSSAFDVLLVGRLDAEKGFDRVVKAVGTLPARRQYHLITCGAGPEEGALNKLAVREGVSLTHAGQLPADQLSRLMTQSHCMVQPSVTTRPWAEQFGRTVAEAMTIGLPVLVSSSGELPNVVDDPRFVFAEDDIAELASKLEKWRTDRAALDSASRAQAETAQRWSPANASARLVEFWAEAYDYSRKHPRPLHKLARKVRRNNDAGRR